MIGGMAAVRTFGTWLGDLLPDPLGSWLLRVSCEHEVEPHVDAEGRIVQPVPPGQ